MDSSVALVSAAFSKPEDESTWTPMDRALSAFTVAIERSSVAGVTDAMKRIKGPITQSLFSPRSALQKTAILLLVGAAKFLQGLFATQGFASEHLPSLLMLCAKASVVMVRLASTAIEDIVTACSSASSPAALLPFASVCLAELRKGAKVSKPLRIVAVDSVKCVVEGLRNNDADGYRLLEVVQEVIRLAISDSASEVRDSGRHLFTEYAQLYSEDRIQKFATTLSPQHIKSLNIKPPTQQPRNATEINRAKVQFGESKQQEFQRLQLKKVEAIATQDLATNHLSLPTSAIDISRLAFIQSDSGRRVMPRKSIDDNLYNSFQPESSLDFETPPNFVDDFDGESILAGVSEGVLGAIEYCIGLPETEEQTVDVTQDIEENHDSEIQKLLAEIEQIENQRNVSPESEPETNKEVVLSEPISSSNQVEEELVVVVVTPSPQSESDEPDEIVVIRASNGSISPAATPTPSMDEISGDIVTTLDVKYTMTLGEEVAAAEASKSYSAPIDMVDDVSVELDPDFAFDGDSPVEVITPDSVVEAPRPDSSIETLLDSPDAESQGIFVVENEEAVIPESHENDEVAGTVADTDGDADTIGENVSPISSELRGFSEEKVDENNVVQFQALSSAGVVETLTVTVVDEVEPSDVIVTTEGPSTVEDTSDALTMKKDEKILSETTVEVSVDSDSQHDGSSVRSISPIPPRSSIMSPEPTLSSSHKNRLSHLPIARTSSLRGSSSTNSISAEMQNVRKHQAIASLPMSQSVPNLMQSPSLQRQTSLPRSQTISSASQLQVPKQDQPSMLRQPTLTRSPSSSPQQIPKPNRFSPSPTSSPPNSPLVPLRRQQSIMSVSPTPKATVTKATSSNFSPSKLVSASQRSDSSSSGDGLRKVMSFANAPSPTPRKAAVTSPTPTPGTLRRINAKVDTGLGSRAPSLRVLSPPPSPTPSSQSMKRISVASSSSSTGSFRNVVHWDASSSETGSNRKSVRWSEDLAVVLGVSDTDNYATQLENQISDAIAGGVATLWQFLDGDGMWEFGRVEDVVLAVLKDLKKDEKMKSEFVKRGLRVLRSVLMVPGVDDTKFLPQECLVDLLKCVLGLTAAAESPDDLLEIEYEVANTLETFESQIRFTTLSQVLATLLSQIEPLLLLTEADGKNSVWVSGHRVCYEMLARAMDAIVTYRDSFGTYDQSVNSELPDADWIGLTNCVVEGLESKYPLTRKAAFDCAVALCKCRGSSDELYNQVESRSGSNRIIVLRGMMERRLH